MAWTTLDWHWWVEAALGSTIVLAVGSLAAKACRQPAHRARVVVLTVLGCLLAPALGSLPFAPRWSAGLIPVGEVGGERTDQSAVMATIARPNFPSGADRTEPGGPAGQGPIATARPVESNTEAARSIPPGPARMSSISWPKLAVLAYDVSSVALTAWWLLGQAMLWRVARSARPASSRVCQGFLAISGPAGERVRLLESDRIALPFTFTWFRPTILLPSGLCLEGDKDELLYALGHEWSHVERRDYRTWTLVGLAGLLLFYQPLFWWLRRQLRLCQDYLADDRAALLGSPEDYAAFLVRLARRRVAGPDLPALGIGDRRSNLYRRVKMLVKDRDPWERRCRTLWGFSAAIVAALVMIGASEIRLDASSPARPDDPKEKPAVVRPEVQGETLNYRGVVKDKDTGKPIEGTTVVVRRSINRSGADKVLQETRHTTDAEGSYTFTIPPDQVAERLLYIELDVEHPDYAPRDQFGYSLAMIRKNEKLGERPFFATVELRPARPITGRIETPDGKPAAGVKLLGFSKTDKLPRGGDEYGSFARAKTDAEGKFRLPITTPGQGVFWVFPNQFAPEGRVIAEGKRGDLGTITLTKGVVVTGVALDIDGKPLVGLLIEARHERSTSPYLEALNKLMVTDMLVRTAETDAQGRFTFGPLLPATYRVQPTDYDERIDRSIGQTRRDLPGVFASKTLTIKEGETLTPLVVRALPTVVIEGQWLDSKGQPRSGWESSVWGQIDGTSWHGQTQPDPQGHFSMNVPRGLKTFQLDIITNEHASAVHRIGKNNPLVVRGTITFETLDHDVKEIEIVRYVAPIILINAKTRTANRSKASRRLRSTTRPTRNQARVSISRADRTKPRPSRTSKGTVATAPVSSCPTAR